MPKFTYRVVALLLIPCILADLSWSKLDFRSNESRSSPIAEATLLTEQALAVQPIMVQPENREPACVVRRSAREIEVENKPAKVEPPSFEIVAPDLNEALMNEWFAGSPLEGRVVLEDAKVWPNALQVKIKMPGYLGQINLWTEMRGDKPVVRCAIVLPPPQYGRELLLAVLAWINTQRFRFVELKPLSRAHSIALAEILNARSIDKGVTPYILGPQDPRSNQESMILDLKQLNLKAADPPEFRNPENPRMEVFSGEHLYEPRRLSKGGYDLSVRFEEKAQKLASAEGLGEPGGVAAEEFPGVALPPGFLTNLRNELFVLMLDLFPDAWEGPLWEPYERLTKVWTDLEGQYSLSKVSVEPLQKLREVLSSLFEAVPAASIPFFGVANRALMTNYSDVSDRLIADDLMFDGFQQLLRITQLPVSRVEGPPVQILDILNVIRSIGNYFAGKGMLGSISSLKILRAMSAIARTSKAARQVLQQALDNYKAANSSEPSAAFRAA